MKYCEHCGAEVLDEAVVCVKCGCKVNVAATKSKNDETMKTLILVFLILGTVGLGLGLFFIPLAWCIPLTVAINNRMKRGEPIGTGLKVCALIFVSLIAGILLLCYNDSNN